ncbi:MAG: TolC family protein [Limnochordia bacterium]|jgi:outer membrane protein TolC|nr:TolC family protein [Limnochordia bacterium]
MLRKGKSVFVVALLLCLTWAFSAQANSQWRELNVQEAVAIALENNLGFQIATLDWQAAQATLERAQIVGDEDMLTEAEKEWEKAQEVYAEKRDELKDLVRTSYQQLLESETLVDNAALAEERAASQLAMDENKYKAGLLSSLDIDRAENSLFDARHRQEKTIIDLETQRMKFNEIIGLPLDEKVLLTERLLLDFVPFNFSLEDCYDLALALDAGVLGAKESLQKAKEAVRIAQSPFTPRVKLEEALVVEEKGKIGLRQAEQTLYFGIRSDYFALLNQVHSLEMAERSIKLERQSLQAEESKYAAGILSNAEIVAQQEKLASLEEQYSAELSLYTQARIKLLQRIGKYEPGESHEE